MAAKQSQNRPKTDLEIICRGDEGWPAALQRLRTAANYTQKQLAELVGCDQSNITNLEGGKYRPSQDLLRKLLVELGQDPRLIYKFMDTPPEIQALIKSQMSPDQMALELSKILLESGSTEESLERIYDYALPKVVASLAIRATRETLAARLLLEQASKFKEGQKQPWRKVDEVQLSSNDNFLPAMRWERPEEQPPEPTES